MRRRTENPLLMGVSCGVVGLLIGGLIDKSGPDGNFWGLFCASAATSAFLTGATLWWFFIENAGPVSIIRGTGWMRGGIVGGLAGFLAHFVCWFLYGLIQSKDPLIALVGLGFSVISIPFFGMITIPSGMFVGALIGRFRL